MFKAVTLLYSGLFIVTLQKEERKGHHSYDNCRALTLGCIISKLYDVIMYTNQKLEIRWNDVTSNRFNVKNGLRQRGVASPLQFEAYTDGLSGELKYFGIGCFIGQHFCGAAGYAYGVILLCPTSSGLRKIIEVRENMHA